MGLRMEKGCLSGYDLGDDRCMERRPSGDLGGYRNLLSQYKGSTSRQK